MKVELIYLLTAFAFWWRLDRLGKQLEAVSHLVRQEMAELVSNEERARELRDEWKQDQDEQKKAIRRMWIFMAVVIGASAFAWWWFTVSQHWDTWRWLRSTEWSSVKLADVEIDELIRALGSERSAWINQASEKGHRHTEAERVTICVLAALEHALAKMGEG
jgi:hypothetical protein